jgi:hypothetical protein
METEEPTHRLLPARFRQPIFLLWLWVIPQLLLLFLNGRAGWLAIGEMTLPQKTEAGWIAACEIGLLLLGLATTLVLHFRKRPAGYVLCALGLLLHSGYLWLFLARFSKAWPAAVAPWMLPQDELLYYQFALIMPALFYFGVRLACFELPLRRGPDTALSLAAFFAIPLSWYLLFQMIRLVSRRWTTHLFPETLAIVFFALSTVLVLMAFLRLLLLIYSWLQEKAWSRLAIPLTAGLLAPLGGLILNRYIPFPCDFQSVGVYVLTVINGLVLLVPTPASTPRAALMWGLRSVLYAFSLYFFVVFLPFLPLSLLAMIACGAGFLILAPTLLFIIHTRQLLSDGAAMVARWGRVRTVFAFVLCLLLIPLGFTVRALEDRTALDQAMTVAFSPDYQSSHTDLNRDATQRALDHLSDMKNGIYLPFLSDYYNHLVFNGMVLPDDKMQLLHRMFFGADLPKPRKDGQWSLLMAPRGRNRGWSGARSIPPPRAVQLQDVAVEESDTNDLVHATVSLTLKNQGAANSEFVTEIVLPDGVLVSGYWLDVAGQRKPGRIVEKKTAQWVYHMIRDFTRRDPGLLVFKTDTQLSLNVYPFAAEEVRTTGLDLLFPRGLRPRIHIGERELTLGKESEELVAQPLAADQPEGQVNVILSGAALRSLPAVTREPYLHFIVDRSAGATNDTQLATEVAALATDLGSAYSSCRITFANYEWADVVPALTPLTAASDTVTRNSTVLPCRGGFCYDRAIAHALLQAQQEGGGESPGDALRVPIFVVVMAKGTTPLSTVNLASFQRLVPDLPFYYLQTDRGYDRIGFAGDKPLLSATNDWPYPVVLLQSGDKIATCLRDSDLSVVSLPGSSRSLQVFDPATRGFVPLTGVRALENSVYTRGLALWDAFRTTVWAPGTLDERLKELVADSRSTGIMIPATSYMVVENTAQEKTLAQKEKQALGTHHALEFEESPPTQAMPEPGTFWLLPISVLLLFWHARRRGERTNGVIPQRT